ncbi:MAG: Yip1 family protein, partial [Caldilinea sp.]
MVERFDQVVEDVREVVATVVTAVESAAATAQGQFDRAVQRASTEFDRRFGGFLNQIGAIFDRFASPQVRLTRLLAQRVVSVAEIEAIANEARPTPAEMTQLLARANASDVETSRLLRLAGITAEQFTAARAVEQAQTDTALAELQPILDALEMSKNEFEDILAQISATPEQVNEWIVALSTTPEQVGSILAKITATPDRLKALVAQARAEVVRMEAPLGERPSRVIRLGGAWLASPLHYAAEWMLFVFVLLLAAKSVGGRATLPQHLGAVALSAAPAIFFLFSYAPYLGNVVPVPTAAAVHTTGRILALIGVVWCGALLLKTISVAHGFGMWKSAGVVLLTWLAIYVLAPLAVLLATSFLMV